MFSNGDSQEWENGYFRIEIIRTEIVDISGLIHLELE